MSPGKVRAPWKEEQVAALNAYQQMGRFHPFTCGEDHPTHSILVAEPAGWRCPVQGCPYTQDWAHEFMVEAGRADG